jgi:hypothetical protein
LPSRALGRCRRCGLLGVGLEAGEDGVADPPFEAPERFFVGLALGDLAVIVDAAVAVGVPDLGDRGHVEGVVDAPVPAQREPVDLAVPEDTSTGAVPL